MDYITTLAVFMHEMTHIWQKQNKTHRWSDHHKMRWQSLILHQNVYKYDLNEEQNFLDLGIEQQASIVEDVVFASLLKTFADDGDVNSIVFKSTRHPKEGVSLQTVLDKNGPVIKRAFKPR